jgi:Tfp pilus assembly protein PilX
MLRHRFRQEGVALVIALIMLVLLTLMVLSAINSGTVNLRISGNMQAEDEARATAQQAIENFIGNYANFYPTPTGIAATGYDINNAGTNEYMVTIATPVCKRAAKQIPPRSTDCASGAKSGLYCWDTLFEVNATATDSRTGVSQSVTQGTTITFPPDFQVTKVGC